MRISRSGR